LGLGRVVRSDAIALGGPQRMRNLLEGWPANQREPIIWNGTPFLELCMDYGGEYRRGESAGKG